MIIFNRSNKKIVARSFKLILKNSSKWYILKTQGQNGSIIINLGTKGHTSKTQELNAHIHQNRD